MAKERTSSVSNPGPLASKPASVRTNRAAPMTRMRERATCTVTMHLRSRTPPKAVPPRSRSEEIRLPEPAWSAGARPLRSPAAKLAKKAKASSQRGAEGPTGQGKQDGVGEELAADAAAGSAECETCADLASSGRGTSEKQASYIQASEAE